MIAADKETRLKLRYAGARLHVEAMAGEEAVRLVEWLVTAGFWFDEFFLILDAGPIMREISEPLRSCLRAFNALPDGFDQAVRFLADFHVNEVLDRGADPSFELFQLFEADLRGYYISGALETILPEDADFQVFRELHKAGDYFLTPYDDIWPSEEVRKTALSEHNKRVIEAAERWRARESGH